MARIFRKLSQLLDLDETNKTAGFSVVVNSAEDGYELADVSGGGGGSDDQTADEVPFTPAGNLAATDVQSALEELDSEKAASSHTHAGEAITSGTVADARIASTIARDSEVTAAVSAHEADTTSVHGIADTSSLLDTSDIGVSVQAFDADLSTYAGITPSANVQSVLSAADFAAIRTLLGLVIGTNVQAFDSDLTTWAGLTPSAFFQTLVDDTDAATARATLGVIASLFQSGGAQAIKLDDLAAPDDNTDLDASTSKHGLMAKFPGGTSTFLRADGTFATPASGGTSTWARTFMSGMGA